MCQKVNKCLILETNDDKTDTTVQSYVQVVQCEEPPMQWIHTDYVDWVLEGWAKI